MEKKIINGVYTITDITSTSQIREFYKEVVEKNIQKYVAITTQNIKFKFNPVTDSAVMLAGDEEYALNPSYRHIEVESLDKLVKEAEKSIEETPVEETAEETVEEVETEGITCEENQSVEEAETESNEEEPAKEDVGEDFVEAEDASEEDICYNNDKEHTNEEVPNGGMYISEDEYQEYRELQISDKEKSETIAILKEDISVKESDLATLRKHVVDLQVEIEEKQKTIEELNDQITALEEEPVIEEGDGVYTVDSIFDIANKLGYEVWIRRK